MSVEKYESGKAPVIQIGHCQSDLTVRCWAETAVSVRGHNVQVEETDTGFTINSEDRLKLLVPKQATLTIGPVHGDLVIRDVSGTISLAEVTGHCRLAGLGQVTATTLHGDLFYKRCTGPFTAESIFGDANLRRNRGGCTIQNVQGDILVRYQEGDVQLGEVSGDLQCRYVKGDINLAQGHRDANVGRINGLVALKQVAGDIRLRGPLPAGKHSCHADGDIVVRWPQSSPLSINATAQSIKNRLTFASLEEEEGTLSGTIGNGKCVLNLTANGRLFIKDAKSVTAEWETPYTSGDLELDFGFDLEGFSERISAQIQDHVNQFAERFESDFAPRFDREMAQFVTRFEEEIGAKAERMAEKFNRKVARQMRRNRQRNRRARASSTPPPKPKASKEEQLKILQMVEKGIISPDEAKTLLDALD